MNGLTNFVKALGVGRIAALAATFAALVGFFVFIIMRLAEPPLAPLYGKLEPNDAAAIVTRLEALGVPYQLQGDGTIVMVPEDRQLRLRMTLSEEGLPSGGTVGYEILDNKDAFGTTAFMEDINRLRALEGELARTIRSIDSVEAARVHLVMPKRELFSSDKLEPTASIVIKARGGGLSQGQVRAIQNLVASAVEGLNPDRVSIIDDRGRLLAAGGAKDPDAATSTAIEERTAAFEQRMRTEVEEIVARVVGPGRARVEVAADMDFNRVTQSAEIFDPDGQVVRSTQTVEENSSNQEGEKDHSVSVANNLPDAQSDGDSEKTTSKAASNRTEETVNYEITRTTKTEILEAGRIKRLSVAVLVDGTTTTDAQGASTYAPRSQEVLDKITTLVRSAIGYDEKRGDQVTVVNLPFAAPATPEELGAEKPFLGLETRDLIRIGESVGLVIVALLMILLVFRPLIARLTSVSRESGGGALPQGAAGAPQLAGPSGGAPAMPSLPGAGPQALPGPQPGMLPRPSAVNNMIDIAQIEGQVKESSVRKVGEIINKHPDEAMSIVRTWLYQGE